MQQQEVAVVCGCKFTIKVHNGLFNIGVKQCPAHKHAHEALAILRAMHRQEDLPPTVASRIDQLLAKVDDLAST